MGVPFIHPTLIGQVMRDARGAAQARVRAGQPSLSEHDQRLIQLRLASPKRAEAGRAVEQQDDAAHLPLFRAANEPKLF